MSSRAATAARCHSVWQEDEEDLQAPCHITMCWNRCRGLDYRHLRRVTFAKSPNLMLARDTFGKTPNQQHMPSRACVERGCFTTAYCNADDDLGCCVDTYEASG